MEGSQHISKVPWSIEPIPVDSKTRSFVDALNLMSEIIIRSALAVVPAGTSSSSVCETYIIDYAFRGEIDGMEDGEGQVDEVRGYTKRPKMN